MGLPKSQLACRHARTPTQGRGDEVELGGASVSREEKRREKAEEWRDNVVEEVTEEEEQR